VSRYIQGAIVRGELRPGEPITETSLSEMLETSRTPIREAFRILAAQGLVTIMPRKGVFVSKLSEDELEQIYAVRINLETMAMRAAVKFYPKEVLDAISRSLESQRQFLEEPNVSAYISENVKFHNVFTEYSGNAYLNQLLRNIEDRTLRYRVFSLRSPGRMEKSYQDHLYIRDFISDGRLGIAEQVLIEHILTSKNEIERQL